MFVTRAPRPQGSAKNRSASEGVLQGAMMGQRGSVRFFTFSSIQFTTPGILKILLRIFNPKADSLGNAPIIKV